MLGVPPHGGSICFKCRASAAGQPTMTQFQVGLAAS
jgi:hypothetical protein